MAVTIAGKMNVGSATAGGPSWLKSGTASKAAFQQAQFNAEQAKANADRMRRFYLNPGEEKTVTFVDGVLDADGMLSFISYNEHRVQTGPKRWDEFVCVGETEICPLCTGGERASYVGVFTVINHTPYTIQNGPNAGKTLGDRRELYVAGLRTLRLLQTYAAKWGGLAGCKVEITRVAESDPRVGNLFQKISQGDPAELPSLYGDNGSPAAYDQEIKFLSAAELLKAGIGQAPSGPGFQKGADVGAAADHM